MKSLFYILSAGIDSDFLDISFIHKWSEELIVKAEKPKIWLIDLTLCSDSDSALDVLNNCVRHYGERLDEEYDRSLIGFLCLGLEKKLLSLDKFLSQVFDAVDPRLLAELKSDLHELYQLFERDQSLSDELQAAISSRFGAYRDESEQLYKYLIADDLYEKEKSMIEARHYLIA